MKKIFRKQNGRMYGGHVWFALLILALVLAACSTPTPEPTPVPPTVEPPMAATPEISQPIARWNSVSDAGTWVLIGYGDALNPTVVEPGTYVTINFSTAGDQVTGSGGCNNYNTTYTADDNYNLTINGPIASTLSACETGMEQEGLFLGALEKVSNYNLTDDGRLLLDYDSGAVYDEQLTFVQGTPFTGTLWVLTAYGDPDNLTPTQTGVMSTAVFSADGTITGSGGCNQYSAGYNVQENTIGISLPVSTAMACEFGTEQEQAFFSALQTAVSYRLGLDALDITTGGNSILRFSAQHLALENVRWQLASINGQLLPNGLIANVLFTPAGSPAALGQDNMISGTGGCNTFTGPYNLAGDTFTTGMLGMTLMMCDEAVMQVEQAFLTGLASVQSYQITLNQLIMTTENGQFLLYADRMPLEGPQWTLKGIGPVDNPQPPLAGSMFIANFARQSGMPSGVKSGGTGCRNYTATYYAGMDAIKVNLPQADQITCADAQTEAEQGYFLGLNAARNYRILGNTLYIYFDNSVLVYEGSYPAAAIGGPLTPLDGTQWWLVSIDTFQLVPGTLVSISFAINPDGRTGTISGSGGCNTYNAGITDVFTLSPVTSTSALCPTPEGIMEQESAYFNALGTANGVFIEGDTLRITTVLETLVFSNVGPVVELPLPITAVINAPAEGQVGQPITFDGSSSSSNVDITSYSWNFGDGTIQEGAVIEHTYATAGTYDVTLTVVDANSKGATASIVITIK